METTLGAITPLWPPATTISTSPEQGQRHSPAQICAPTQYLLCSLLPLQNQDLTLCSACSTLACPDPCPSAAWHGHGSMMSQPSHVPLALRDACTSCAFFRPSLSGPQCHEGMRLSPLAQSTVLPLKADILPLYQQPNHIPALNHHSSLFPRDGSCLGRCEGTCSLCTMRVTIPKSRDQCLDYAFLAIRFYSLCVCHKP